MFPSVQEMLNTYQARASDAGVDLLGHYMAPLAYAQMQVVAQAVEATGGFDDASLSAYARSATFHTVMGDIKFGANGEWAEPRVLQVQFQGISGHEVEPIPEWVEANRGVTGKLRPGKLSYPYAEALSAKVRG